MFGDVVADLVSIDKANPVVTELFVRDRKLNIYLVFIIQSYVAVPKKLE